MLLLTVLNADNIPRSNFINRMRSHPHYKPPGQTEILTLQDAFSHEIMLYGLLTDVVLYASFLAMLLAVVNIRHNFEIFMRNESIRQRLFDNKLYRDVSNILSVIN